MYTAGHRVSLTITGPGPSFISRQRGKGRKGVHLFRVYLFFRDFFTTKTKFEGGLRRLKARLGGDRSRRWPPSFPPSCPPPYPICEMLDPVTNPAAHTRNECVETSAPMAMLRLLNLRLRHPRPLGGGWCRVISRPMHSRAACQNS